MGVVLMVRTVSQVVREAVPKKTVEMHPQESEPVIAPTKGLDSLDLESLFSGLMRGLLPKPLGFYQTMRDGGKFLAFQLRASQVLLVQTVKIRGPSLDTLFEVMP